MKKIKIILASLGMILGIGLLAPISAGAQVVDPCTIDPTGYLCQHKDDDILVYVNNIINWVIIVLGFLAVIMLIYAGITYVISAGDAKKVEKAKSTIMYAIIGLVIAILAYAIVNFVIGMLKSKA